MEKLEIKTEAEWKGTSLCEAVLSSIGILNRYHNRNKTSKCKISGCSGPKIYIAKSSDIYAFLENHPNKNKIEIEKCLDTLEKDNYIEGHWTGGYLLN